MLAAHITYVALDNWFHDIRLGWWERCHWLWRLLIEQVGYVLLYYTFSLEAGG